MAKFSRTWSEILLILAGCIIYALSIICISQVTIVPGSVIGIAVICNTIFKTPIGIVNLVLNIPILIIGTKFIGKKLLLYTLLTLFGTSLLIDLFNPLSVHVPLWQPLVISILGGLSMGIGAGILLKAGATMGGTTAIARLIQLKYPAFKIGNSLILMDGVIIIFGVVFLKDYMALVYSILYTVVCMKTIDLILYRLKYSPICYKRGLPPSDRALHGRLSQPDGKPQRGRGLRPGGRRPGGGGL
jgi:uncharacterized membrane-anchored protein YitT (DUF2179 family)